MKSYIGQTIDEKARQDNWQSGKYYSSPNSKIDRARQQYDTKLWTYEILFRITSNRKRVSRLLDKKERYYINKYDSYYNGYNSTKGGSGIVGARMRAVVQLDLDGNYLNTFYSGKRVKNYLQSLGFVVKTENPVIACCSKYAEKSNSYQSDTSFGFIWLYEEDYIRLGKNINPVNNNKYLRVVQLSMSGQFIKFWLNPLQIKKELGYDNSGIVKCCKGKQLSYKGFRWVYKTDYDNGNIGEYKLKNRIVRVSPIDYSVEIYEYLDCAAESLASTMNIKKSSVISSISTVCSNYDLTKSPKNIKWSAYNYIWFYEKDYMRLKDSLLDSVIRKYIFPFTTIQCDLSGNIIGYWNSPNEAGSKLNLNCCGISNNCIGRYNSSQGYIWKYYKDLTPDEKEKVNEFLKTQNNNGE